MLRCSHRSRIDALRGGIYSVRSDEVRWLDDAGLGYHRATDAEIEEARRGVLTLREGLAR